MEFLVRVRSQAVRIRLALELIGLAIVAAATRHSRHRSNSDVLGEEVLGGKVVHEVLGSDDAAVLFIFFDLESLELLADGVSDSLEQVGKGLLADMSRNILTELLVDLLDDLRAPALNLIIDEVDLAAELVGDFLLFSVLSNPLVQSFDLRRVRLVVVGSLFAELVVLVVVLHLEFVQLRSKHLVVAAELVRFSLILTDGRQKLRISLLAGQKFSDDLIDVGVACFSPDLLESVLDVAVLVHLGVHLPLEERRVQPLDQELLLHLDLVLVLVFIRGQLGDGLLALAALQTILDEGFSVRAGLLQDVHALLSLALVHLNLNHDLPQHQVGLVPRLLGLPALVDLAFQDALLLLKALA